MCSPLLREQGEDCMPQALHDGPSRPARRWCGRARLVGAALGLLLASALPAASAPSAASPEPLHLYGVPVDVILFALTLLGVAMLHRHTLYVALAGLAAIVAYQLGFTGFKAGRGLAGLIGHM